MKKLLIALLSIMTVATISSCSSSDGNGGSGGSGSSYWQQAVEEHPFLSNFPAFEYTFKGQYQSGAGIGADSEAYVLSSWEQSEDVADEYKSKLRSAGFKSYSDDIYSKTKGSKIYTCAVSYGSGMLAISFGVASMDF